jgi:hypothetical protein
MWREMGFERVVGGSGLGSCVECFGRVSALRPF